VDVRRAVAGELDGEQAGPRADVEAAGVGAEPLAVEVTPEQEAARVGARDVGVDHEVGQVEREQRAPAAVAEAQAGRALPCVSGDGRMRGAGLRVGERGARGADVLDADAAAAAHDLGALLAPAQRELGVLVAADRVLRPPSVRRQVAEVGVDAEREVREVAEP
jgi:hypothetical protein